MSNQIRLKRGSGSAPSASDLVVGEVALRTDNGRLFTKKDDGNIAEIGAAAGVSDGDKGDITVSNSGATFTIDSGVITSDKILDGTITGSDLATNVDLVDDKKIRFGTGNDLEIYHNGTNSIIDNINTGAALQIKSPLQLKLKTNQFVVKNSADTESLIYAAENNKVVLYYDGSERLETTANGVEITGTITTSGDITINESNPSIFFNDTGDNPDYEVGNHDGAFVIQDNTNSVNRLVVNTDGHIDIAGNVDFGAGIDVTGASTFSGGITSTGNLTLSSVTPQLYFTDTDHNPDYAIWNHNGVLKFLDTTNSNATRLEIQADGKINIAGNLEVGNFVRSTNGYGVGSSTVISASRVLQNVSLSSTSVTATTQSAGDNSTKIATTAYTDTAIANLIDSSPSTLNTLNELASALGDDPNFATTVTNSIATKMPLAGGTFTGNVTYGDDVKAVFGAGNDLQIFHDGSNSVINDNGTGSLQLQQSGSTKLFLQSNAVHVNGNIVVSGTVDGRDIATDGTKLDGIESNATADQTASEILTLLKTVDGSGSGLDADTLDGFGSGQFIRSDVTDTVSGGTKFTSTGLELSGHWFNRYYDSANAQNYIHLYPASSSDRDTTASTTDIRAWTGSTFKVLRIKGDSNDITWGGSKLWTAANDGSGSGLDSDTVDGIQASSFLRSDADDSFNGTIVAQSDGTNPVIKVTGSGPNFIQFATDSSGTVDADSINFIYRTSPNTLAFERASDATILFSVDADNGQTNIPFNLDVGQGLDVTGNITVTGTVDGVDIAARDTLFGSLISSSATLTDGVIATTQSAGDSSTKVATTAFVSTAVSNLVDSAPGTLNTLNELAAALGDDANFSTTVTNSIATKLPLAGGTLTGNVTSNDNVKAIFGTGNDLQIYHDGSNSHIGEFGTGDLRFTTNGQKFDFQKNGGEVLARFIVDGAVELYHNNSKKFETTASGVSISGDVSIGNDTGKFLSGAGNDLQLYHDGGNSVIDNLTGGLFIKGTGSTAGIQLQNRNGNESMAKFFPDGAVELYYDNSKKFETQTNGVTVQGSVFALGTTPQLRLNSDTNDGSTTRAMFGMATGDNNFVNGSTANDVVLNCPKDFIISHGSTENMAKFKDDSSVELYYDGSKKFQTENYGISTVGDIYLTGNLLATSDTSKLLLGGSNDLQIYHDGSDSIIKGIGTGSLVLESAVTNEHLQVKAGVNGDFRAYVNNGTLALICNAATQNAELHCGGSKKFETTSTGVDVTGTITMDAVPGTNTNAALPVLFQTSSGVIDGGSQLTYNPGGDVLSINGNHISANVFRGDGSTGTLTCDNHSSTTFVTVSNTVDIGTVDNVADAFTVKQGSNEYITVDTTNSSEAITIGNNTTNPTVAVVGTFTVNGASVLTAADFPSIGTKITATGGSTSTVSGFKVHDFTSSGTFEITAGTGELEVLVVGGGGSEGGGNSGCHGGGGGGGGGVFHRFITLGVGKYQVTIGGGGGFRSNGGDSRFFSIRALGGGAGGPSLTGNGNSGGSGGGASRHTTSNQGGASTQLSQVLGGLGNAGGNIGSNTNPGGGGGAGGVGQSGNTSETNPGRGGPGVQFTQFGVNTYFGAGGNGNGGGSDEGPEGQTGTSSHGAANTGAGGGGSSGGGTRFSGGSGRVMIRYAT